MRSRTWRRGWCRTPKAQQPPPWPERRRLAGGRSTAARTAAVAMPVAVAVPRVVLGTIGAGPLGQGVGARGIAVGVVGVPVPVVVAVAVVVVGRPDVGGDLRLGRGGVGRVDVDVDLVLLGLGRISGGVGEGGGDAVAVRLGC